MPITGRFLADFESFYAAVQKADVSLRGLETGAGKVGTSLNKMVDQFSGRKLIQDATLSAEAVERIGGTTKLTTAELQRLGAQATEAAAKLKALGVDVPPGIQKIAAAAKEVEASTSKMAAPAAAAGLSFKTLFSSFTAAGVATQLIGKLTTEVTKMVDAGMRLPAIEQGFKRLNASVGQNSQEMLASLSKATKGMVSDLDLMQSSNKALLLGLPVTKESMGELAGAATALGRAMGMDATKSLDDLITALGRSSPMILDNLGLTVKVGEANEVYAAKLGKTADELTDAEKKTAFYEAAMEAARKKTQELGDQTKTLGEIVTTVWTSVGNVVSGSVAQINVGVGSALSSLKNFVQFSQDAIKFGGAAAVVLAELREQALAASQAGQNKGGLSHRFTMKDSQGRPVTADVFDPLKSSAPPVDPLIAYRKELEAIRVAVSKLTPAQKTLITESQKYGKTTEEIAKALGLSKTAVDGYIKSLAEQTRGTKDVEKATKEWEAAQDKAAAAGVKAFKDWHAAIDDLNFDMKILVATRLKDLGDQSKKVLSEATAWTATWIKLLQTGLPVVAGLGEGFDKIGTKVDINTDLLKKWEAEWQHQLATLDAVAVGFRVVGEAIGGVDAQLGAQVNGIGNLISQYADLQDALRKTRDAQLAKTGSSDLSGLQTFSSTLSWITLIIQGVKIMKGLFEKFGVGGVSDAERALAKMKKEVLDASGGIDTLRLSFAQAGISADAVFKSKTAVEFTRELARATKAAEEMDDRMGRLGLTWRDLGQHVRQLNVDTLSSGLIKDFRVLTLQGVDADKIIKGMSGSLSQLIVDAVKTGSKIPAALKPILEQLIKMGGLTDAAARAMLGLQESTMPALADIKDAADRYGLTLDQLGPKVKQLEISETADQIVKDFKLLSLAGANVETVMGAMKDKVQKLVTEALKLGLELPESMKPLIEAMIKAGLLTDADGRKLTELGNLQFSKPLAERFDELIDKLGELIDAMSKVGTAAEEGFGRARGAAEALGRAIPRGSVPGAPEPDTGTPGRPPAVPRPEGPGGPPSNSDDNARVDDDGGAPPGPPGRKNPNPSTADIAAMMASARMPAFADSQSLGRVLPFPSPALTPAEAALTASPSVQTGTGTVVHVHVDLDGREIAEAQVPYIPDAVKRYGLA